MTRSNQIFQRQTISNKSVTVGETKLTPQAQTLTIRWSYGGLAWNRPDAVVVERGGQTDRIPIIDVTRITQWLFLGFSLIFISVTILLSIQQRRKDNE